MVVLVIFLVFGECWVLKSYWDVKIFICSKEIEFLNILIKWFLNKDKKSEIRWVIFIVCKI